jgi:2-oxoglutarate ferredoxin oxidoreductase subunit delta
MNQTLNISIDSELCKGCEYCLSLCPRQVIRLSKDYNSMGHRYAVIESDDRCTRCRSCAIICPDIAIIINQKMDLEVERF